MTPKDLTDIFFVECEESLQLAEAGLAACQEGTHDDDTINAVFRGVHSIKGGAGAFGYWPLQGFTHIFETLLSDVRDCTVAIEPHLVDLLLRALDTVSDHVTAAREGGDPPADAALLAELEAAMAANQGKAAAFAAAVPVPVVAPAPAAADDFDLDALLDGLGDEPAETVPEKEWLVQVRPHAGAMLNGSEPVLLLRELVALGGQCLACDTADLPDLDKFDPAQGYLVWTFAMPATVSEDALRELFDFLGEDCDLAIGADAPRPALRLAAPPPPVPVASVSAGGPDKPAASAAAAPRAAAAAPGQSVRIDLAKLDRLIDTVGELVIAQAMLAQRLGHANLANVEELGTLDVLVRDIQESAMAFRAQPIDTVFGRVPRLLRELGSSTGKRVRLEVSGETTELDKTVIERLGEPLTHLIRNAVDHGIETPEERLAAGKSAEGTLTLSAEQRAGRVLIRIADDGRGIDRARVLAKARERGLVAANATPSDEEIDLLIFAPGFSTAQAVSNISGRGVGMDVVRQNVKDLGGRITIESVPEHGTAFVLALPLTLAISDGMIVEVGDQTLVVPLAHVVESLRPAEAELKGVGSGRQMLNVRGRFIPVVPLCQALGDHRTGVDKQAGVLIVVETGNSGRAALAVDAITDQRQFVIKSLERHYCHVDGVAGATIMGDGRVALILDVDQLVASHSRPPAQLEAA
ncbi:chemotaxis protein CheA [Alteraurantiacibacter buctensis]|uniref:Chemotaxis protein CheA n=1 Tax=Alteraurantiacibacter buctensis TaxID=1503981 RepID=A0A844YRZ6_9SPHN|nr:chemotaxis protein CheA [Alteraurantiacibacter buctensis]MXO71125.1 chemotaxis protein CheA [Alteraurantiacibacter buctensis]